MFVKLKPYFVIFSALCKAKEEKIINREYFYGSAIKYHQNTLTKSVPRLADISLENQVFWQECTMLYWSNLLLWFIYQTQKVCHLKTPVTIFSGNFHVCNCTFTRTLWVRENYSVPISIQLWEIKKDHENQWKCNNTFPEHLPHMKNVRIF